MCTTIQSLGSVRFIFEEKNPIMVSLKILITALFNIDNNKCFVPKCWAENQHIRMISEGSGDTEAWSNDAENVALHHMNKLQFKIY